MLNFWNTKPRKKWGPEAWGPKGWGPEGLGPEAWGPKGWGPEGLGPEAWGPKGWAPKGGPGRVGARRVGSPKFRVFFSLSRHSFHSFLPLLLVLSWNFGGV